METGDTVAVDKIECLKKDLITEVKQELINSALNPFEFPRQQRDDKIPPAVIQFTAAQRLFNPNQLNSSDNNQQRKPSKMEETATTSSTDRFRAAVDAFGSNIVSSNKRRAETLNLRIDNEGKFNGFGGYMAAKTNKLMDQVHSNLNLKSTIFNGLSFYIDGLTHPPANEIRELVTENGGEYHHYYKNGRTTYFVAEELASTKVDKVRKEQRIIKPTFITDSIKAGRVLPEANYYLLKNQSNHVNQFFDRSRLHLISTMAKELKKFVFDMKKNEKTHQFRGREKLEHLQSSVEFNTPIICHIDMDCFFVSVALRNRPDLLGRPVAITHSTVQGQANGEIASCSYEAREKGCYARMFVKNALQLCPDLQCLPYQFEEYVSIAKQLYSIIASYTLRIQAVSCDELYFDLGSICKECRISDPLALITIIRNDIFQQTKCIASAGLGPNALIARMATKKAKPNGQWYVTVENAQDFIGNAPISDLPTVGWTTCENIHQQLGSNIKLCKQLFPFSIDDLRKVLGSANGEKVYQALRGNGEKIDFDNILIDQKSVSVNVNFGIRFKTAKDLHDTMKSVSSELSQRLIEINKAGTSLTLKLLIRKPDAPIETVKYGAHGSVDAIRKSLTLSQTFDAEKIFKAAIEMIKSLKPVITDIRGVALHMNKLFDIRSVTTKKDGTLWNFMEMQNVMTKSGASKPELGAFKWVAKSSSKTKKKPHESNDDDYFSPNEEQDEMRMKLSEVCQMMPPPKNLTSTSRKQFFAPKETPNAPSKPKLSKPLLTFSEPVLRRITRTEICINEIFVNFTKPPEPYHFSRLFNIFKAYIQCHNTGSLTEVVANLEFHVTRNAAKEEWKPLIQSLKRYLNWYHGCRYKNAILFDVEKSEKDEKKDYANFQKLMIRENQPKIRQKPLPDISAQNANEDIVSIEATNELGPSTSKCENNKKTVSTLNKTDIRSKDRRRPSPDIFAQDDDDNDGDVMSVAVATEPNPLTSKSKNNKKVIIATHKKDSRPKDRRRPSPDIFAQDDDDIDYEDVISVKEKNEPGPSTFKSENNKKAVLATNKTDIRSKDRRRPSPDIFAHDDDDDEIITSENEMSISEDTNTPGPSTSKSTNTKKDVPATNKIDTKSPRETTTKPSTSDSSKIMNTQMLENMLKEFESSNSQFTITTSKPRQNLSTSKSNGDIVTATKKANSNILNSKKTLPNSDSNKNANGAPKNVRAISRSPTPAVILIPKPSNPPPPTRTTTKTAPKQKPSNSKNAKIATKTLLTKQTSFDTGVKRKQTALADVWNKFPALKKKRQSLPARKMATVNDDDDDVCIIDEVIDLNQSVIALN